MYSSSAFSPVLMIIIMILILAGLGCIPAHIAKIRDTVSEFGGFTEHSFLLFHLSILHCFPTRTLNNYFPKRVKKHPLSSGCFFTLFLLTKVAVQQSLEGLAVTGLVAGHFIVSPTGRPLRVLWESRYGAVFQRFSLATRHISSQVSLKKCHTKCHTIWRNK